MAGITHTLQALEINVETCNYSRHWTEHNTIIHHIVPTLYDMT